MRIYNLYEFLFAFALPSVYVVFAVALAVKVHSMSPSTQQATSENSRQRELKVGNSSHQVFSKMFLTSFQSISDSDFRHSKNQLMQIIPMHSIAFRKTDDSS
jgi:hypothetical protein